MQDTIKLLLCVKFFLAFFYSKNQIVKNVKNARIVQM